jgi:hypothetical protein
MKMIQSPSSNIAAIGYDATTATLRVQFRSQGVWDYKDVPEDRWEALKAAESHGKHFHAEIKRYYEATRVKDAEIELAKSSDGS